MLKIVISLLICQLSHAELLTTYLTWQQVQTHDNITINFITTEKATKTIRWRGAKKRWAVLAGKGEKLPGQLGYMNRVELTGLNALSEYSFQVQLENGKFSEEFKFMTLPKKGGELKFLQGGDVGATDRMVSTAALAVQNDPDVILIGGDIAYANGLVKNYDRWRRWFLRLNQVTRKSSGHLIPVVVAVGNHEVAKFSGTNRQKAPFFTVLFDQSNERSFFHKTFSDHTQLLVLDSAHMTSHASQIGFIKERLSANWSNQLALYHAPLYPSHRGPNNYFARLGKKHWLPAFDSGNLDLALENHDHVLKRTKMLKGGKSVTQKGTVYIGDGCWGRPPREAKQRDYLEVSIPKMHVWFGVASKNKIHLRAMNKTKVLDEFTLDTKNRVVLSKAAK